MTNSERQFLAIKLAVFITAFLLPILVLNHALAHDDTPWIAPNSSSTAYWNNVYTDADTACTDSPTYEQSLISQPDLTHELVPIVGGPFDGYMNCNLSNANGIFQVILIVRSEITEDSCTELDYPNPEDTNADTNIDHCHASECDRNGEMFESNGLNSGTGYVCVAQGNGEYCEHSLGNLLNDDGSNGLSVASPTGESCGSDSSDFEHPDWQPLDDNELPDPTDPNSPPSDDGNSECTPIDGTALNVCNDTVENACENVNGSFICPSGCGEVNNNFVCIREDGGGEPVEEENNNDNDNSDNQANDDENTAGDEGTHSRLDGLLENTDGLEGLLEQIKDKLDEPTESEEEEEECPAGQIDIGDSCVLFDKNDQPTQADLDFTEIDQLISDSKAELSTLFNDIKTSMDSKFTTSLTGGAYTVNTVNIKGADVDFGMARLSSLFDFNLFGSFVMFAFGIRSLFILVGG